MTIFKKSIFNSIERSLNVIETYHLPLKVSVLIIAELAQAGVESAMTFTFISRFKLDVINCDKSTIPSGLITLRLGDGFEKQLKLGK